MLSAIYCATGGTAFVNSERSLLLIAATCCRFADGIPVRFWRSTVKLTDKYLLVKTIDMQKRSGRKS
jgi:hypothetical protein